MQAANQMKFTWKMQHKSVVLGTVFICKCRIKESTGVSVRSNPSVFSIRGGLVRWTDGWGHDSLCWYSRVIWFEKISHNRCEISTPCVSFGTWFDCHGKKKKAVIVHGNQTHFIHIFTMMKQNWRSRSYFLNMILVIAERIYHKGNILSMETVGSVFKVNCLFGKTPKCVCV